MRNQPIPLVSGFYRDEDRPFSQQDVWGYLPCKTEAQGTRSQLMLKTDPGLYPFLEAGAGTVRGIHDVEGRLCAVIGTQLYRINNAGVAIPIGTIPGNGRVSMDHNQIANGNQLTVANGSAGYVYNTVDGSFQRITDEGFPGSPIIKFLDGVMLGIDPAGRFAFNSDPANALAYNTLNRWTSEYRPDRLVSMGRAGGELLLLSTNSGEFFQNTGAANQPFRTKQIYLDKGCAGPHTVVEADNTIFWLGSDGYFYQLDGYGARRISTRPIEQAIRGLDWWNAFGFLWESEGHTCVCWTFLNGQTWRWDTSQQEWSRRESYGFDRWRVSCTTRSNGQWIAGDLLEPKLWRIQWGYPWEGDVEFVSGFTQPVIHDNQNDLVHKRLEIVMDVGSVVVTPGTFPEQPVGPQITGDAPDGVSGDAYSYPYTITLGDAPIVSVQIINGTLPPGLSINLAGVLSGTPTGYGSHSFTVRITDANGLPASVSDTILIGDAMAMALYPHIVLWAEMDEVEDDVAIEEVAANHGEYRGVVEWEKPDPFGTELGKRFGSDSDAGVFFPSTVPLQLSSGMTVITWIARLGDAYIDEFMFSREPPGGLLGLQVYPLQSPGPIYDVIAANVGEPGEIVMQTPDALDGEWHMITASFAGDETGDSYLYLDASLTDTDLGAAASLHGPNAELAFYGYQLQPKGFGRSKASAACKKCIVLNKTLNLAETTWLYNSGNGWDYATIKTMAGEG